MDRKLIIRNFGAIKSASIYLNDYNKVGNTNKISKEEIPPKVMVSLPLLL